MHNREKDRNRAVVSVAAALFFLNLLSVLRINKFMIKEIGYEVYQYGRRSGTCTMS